MSGTPVISSKNGAMPEIIIDGKIGYNCTAIPEYMKAILNIDKIKPLDCRKYAEQNYSDTVAAAKHLVYYNNILTKGSTT